MKKSDETSVSSSANEETEQVDGSGDGDGASNGESDLDSDDTDVELLVALAELDAEAAEAYRIAAEYAEDDALRTGLEGFRRDHLRHVETLNGVLSKVDGPQVSLEMDEGSSSVTMLAAAMGTLGVRAALMAMIANEQLTNSVYHSVTELPFEDDVAQILESHLADEQRHLAWLIEQEARARKAGAEVGVDV